ncbi:hypothetical protein F2981_21920 (plasmid) [Sinorhizobium meliloti]|nr:hypothetical protein [Sinorhizobium meliloti]
MRFSKIFLGAATALILTSSAYAETELTVYTSIEAVDLDRYKEHSKRPTPTSRSTGSGDSTGVMTPSFWRRKTIRRPTWSGVWLRHPACSEVRGHLEPYSPKNVEALEPPFPWMATSRRAGWVWTHMWRLFVTIRWRRRSSA